MKLFAAGFATATVLFVGLILAAYYRPQPAGEESSAATAVTLPVPTTPSTSVLHRPPLPRLPDPLSATKAETLLLEAGYERDASDTSMDGSILTLYSSGYLKCSMFKRSGEMVSLSIWATHRGDDSGRVAELRREARTLVRSVTGEPLPEDMVERIGTAEHAELKLGRYRVNIGRRDAATDHVTTVGVYLPPPW